eukprot:1605036-Pleurochrysis_carterae.AAC.1
MAAEQNKRKEQHSPEDRLWMLGSPGRTHHAVPNVCPHSSGHTLSEVRLEIARCVERGRERPRSFHGRVAGLQRAATWRSGGSSVQQDKRRDNREQSSAK